MYDTESGMRNLPVLVLGVLYPTLLYRILCSAVHALGSGAWLQVLVLEYWYGIGADYWQSAACQFRKWYSTGTGSDTGTARPR